MGLIIEEKIPVQEVGGQGIVLIFGRIQYIYWMYAHSVGSVLLAYAGEGGDDGCLFQLSEDSTMTGFTLYYPKQDPKMVPKPYPW